MPYVRTGRKEVSLNSNYRSLFMMEDVDIAGVSARVLSVWLEKY